MPSALALRPRRELGELAVSVALTAGVVLLAFRLGLVAAFFLALLAGTIVLGVASPRGYAVVVLFLAPLPSLDALLGVEIPIGLDPLDVLVVLGAGLALRAPSRFPLARNRLLLSLVLANLGLLALAWYRTYGQETLDGASFALLVKPVVVVAGALIVVQLLPRESAGRTLGLAMAAVLGAVAASVVLQRLGVYRTPHQEANAAALGLKQYGGLMLDGNAAGSMFAIFAVPAFVLLREAGRRWLGIGVLVVASPVLLITLARGSLVAFVAGLLALAALDRRGLRGIKVATVVLGLAAAWALTAGRSQIGLILDTLVAQSGDTNARLSGRLEIWEQSWLYLTGEPHRWLLGGGLHAFQDFVLASPLEHAFAPHNLALRLLTSGGAVTAAAFALLLLAFWSVGGTALRTALVSYLVLGLVMDADLFGRPSSWLWVLAAAACQADARPAAARMRSAIRSTPYGRSGRRISSRSSAVPEGAR